MLIDGKLVEAKSGQVFDNINPAPIDGAPDIDTRRPPPQGAAG